MEILRKRTEPGFALLAALGLALQITTTVTREEA
jgi:hypothetical protein